MPQFLKILVQTKFGKFILQMYPEIHILYRVNNDIYELHTGNHEFYVKTIILGEVCHKRSESSSLRANFLEVVERGENNFVATLYQTDSSKKFQNQSFRSEKKIMVLFTTNFTTEIWLMLFTRNWGGEKIFLPQTLVHQTERYAVDCLTVLDDHVETVL